MITALQENSKENVRMEDGRRIKSSKSPLGSKDHSKTREALCGLDNARLSGCNGMPPAFSGSDSMTERLRIQRQKALKTLEKVSNPDRASLSSLKHLQVARLPKSTSKKSPKSIGFNHTDVPINKNFEFNISDLVADHTIDIKSMTSSGTVSKISFEPSEITGRSTMCLPRSDPEAKVHRKTVKDILSQSLVDDVRSLSDTLPSYDSLTRTVDNIPDSNASSCRASFAACARDDNSELFGESFKPAEMMNSQLCADERAWEQQFADIPNLHRKTSDEKQKRLSDTMRLDNNFSIGDYFSKHSESIRNIVPNIKSPLKRPPVALHEESMDGFSDHSMLSNRKYSMENRTPRIDGKRYSEYIRPSMPPPKNHSLEDEIDKAQRMNMMAIKKALYEINPEDTVTAIRSKLSSAMRDMKINMLDGDEHEINQNLPSSSFRKAYLIHKDNSSLIKDRAGDSALEDTLSVTKSYLEMSGSSCNSFGSPTKREHDKNNRLQLAAPSTLKSRKRSHSSTRLDSGTLSDQEVPIRRSRSPATHSELAAASGSRTNPSMPTASKSHLHGDLSSRCKDHSMTESDRQFLIETKSPDCGKYSLPSYGMIARSGSTLSNQPSKLRCNSQCSSSSEFSHRDGKLPLKASILEVSWGCVKLRKSVQKSIHIKNTSNKRLILKAEVSGPGFQLVTSSEESSNIIRLHSQECRTLNLNFCPTVIGAAAGQLVFSPPYGNVSGEGGEVIKLYGHGGHCNVIPRGILKGPIGSAYLPLGELKQLSTDLKTSFTLFNKGPLTGFAYVMVESVGLELPRLCDCMEVRPKTLLIKPESSATITITFRPRRDDIKKIFRKLVNKNMEVITLANLKVLTGENATRRRIHSLIQQMNDSEKSNFEGTSLSLIWASFPDEEPLKPVEIFKERVASTFDLLSTLRTHEIAITLSHSILENTVQDTLLFSGNDETILFRTIVSDASFCNSTNEDSDSVDIQRNSVESCSVRPSKVEIDLADKAVNKAVFTIHSNFFLKKQFRVDTNVRHVLQCSPMNGSLMPGEVVQVKIQMKFGFLPTGPIQIWVYLDDLKITLPVVIKNGNFPTHIE